MGTDASNNEENLRVPTPVQVAVAANAAFLMPLAVMLRTIDSAHEPGGVAVTVIHDGLPATDRERVAEGLSGLELTWLHAPLEKLQGARYPTILTRASLFRLLLPELLPALDRVIYVDIDTLVIDTLRPLWDLDLTGWQAAAVRDAGNPFVAGPGGPDWRALGLNPDDPYLNSGLLVVALDAWRSDEVSARALDMLRKDTFQWGDQDALNVTLRGRWKELPRRWNLQTKDAQGAGIAWALWREDVERAVAHPAVIHYTEHLKPWHAGNRHPLESRWYAVLDQTSFGGWRPKPAGRPLYRRVGSRTKSALRALVARPSDPSVFEA